MTLTIAAAEAFDEWVALLGLNPAEWVVLGFVAGLPFAVSHAFLVRTRTNQSRSSRALASK